MASPKKTAPNKSLNVIYDGKGVRNTIISAFALSVIMIILTEVLFRA